MYETNVCMVGRVGSEVRFARTDNGTPLASFRLVSTTRRFDRGQGGWVDGNTKWVTVLCRRGLADHVGSSVAKGEPVVVYGELRSRSWERDGRSGNEIEIFAHTVGHDLNWGTASYRRSPRNQQDGLSDDEVADRLVQDLQAETSTPNGEESSRSSSDKSSSARSSTDTPVVTVTGALPSRREGSRSHPRATPDATPTPTGVGGRAS